VVYPIDRPIPAEHTDAAQDQVGAPTGAHVKRLGEAHAGEPSKSQLTQRSLASALALTKTPFPPTTPPAAALQTLDLKTSEVEQALGYAGKANGGVLQFSVPRMEKISDSGMDVPPAMGTATAINFQPTGQGKAAISGDFVLLASEVNPVLRALRTHGIEVEAMHNHMLFDQPHLYFMHFWANDDAVKLALGLRAALDETNSQKPHAK